VELIRGRLAFYANQVEVYAVDEARVNPRAHSTPVAEVIQHTDSGDGASQKDHWRSPPDRPRP
jgi:hypothetical protein